LSKKQKAAREAEAARNAKAEAKREEEQLAADGAFRNAVCGHSRPTRAPEGELLKNVDVDIAFHAAVFT
jgi:hypothetical protein